MEQALAQPNKHGGFERLACANVCNQSLQLLLSGAPRNERHKSRDESQRTVGLPRGSCTLADPMGGSLSLRSQLENQKGGHHLVFQLQGSSLMHGLESRMRNGILTIRNDVSLHKVHLALRSLNSRGAQDQGRTASVKLGGATST